MHRRYWRKVGERNDEPHQSYYDGGAEPTPQVRIGVDTYTTAIHDGDDDESSSSSSSSETSSVENARDCSWSLASNGLFLAGSAIQAGLATWDLLNEEGNDGKTGDDGPGDGDDDEENDDVFDGDDYLATFAASLIVANALLDVAWVRANNGARRDFSSAATLGVGAALEALSTLFPGEKDPRQYGINMLSCHIYLLSGLLSMRGQHRPSSLASFRRSSCPEILMTLGLVFFAAGSLIDVVMSYLYNPQLVSNISELVLQRCALASSLLWVLDAILYVVADFIIYSVPGRMVRFCRQSAVLRGGGAWCRKDIATPSKKAHEGEDLSTLVGTDVLVED